MGKRVFRIAAGADESAYVVAFPWRAHAFPTRDHPARNFKARNGALARRRRIDTFALQAIGTIDARCGDFDQNLARPRFWHRRLAGPDYVRAAMTFEMNLPHHEHGVFRFASSQQEETQPRHAGFMKK
jgi:hypothetical protein